MLTIGTILQCGQDPTELYETKPKERLYSAKHKDTYVGYPLCNIQQYIDEGRWQIVSSSNYSPEIY